MHKLFIALAAVAVVQASPATAQDAGLMAEIEAARDALNDAFASHDRATIERMVTADHVGVTSLTGVQTTAEQLATLDDWKARYFDYSPPNVTLLAPNVLQITYENAFEGTYAGKTLPARVFVSQIWLKEDGAWRQQLYQQTPLVAE